VRPCSWIRQIVVFVPMFVLGIQVAGSLSYVTN
jgi:hypothetical protein